MIRRSRNFMVICAVLSLGAAAQATNLLQNGDFEAPATLGPVQTQVSVGTSKMIETNAQLAWYKDCISGITGWTYSLPMDGYNGTGSDHGLARLNANFGLDENGQSAFINNWNRMMSQAVTGSFMAGDEIAAFIDFGTLGGTDPADTGRAGTFYLLAGGVDPLNHDQFAVDSIILSEVTAANHNWGGSSDVQVGNGEYTRLSLAYTYGINDPAIGRPLTLAFKTVDGSWGPTYWDNAALLVRDGNVPVPEPGVLPMLLGSLISGTCLFARRCRNRG